MKIKFISTLAIALSMMSGVSHASLELAKSKNCMACHAQDKKLVGPSYNDVKDKYAKDSRAAENLAIKVKKGGGGVWGAIPMPANGQVTEAEAKTLVNWILGK